jgi:hypothetical protein
MTRTAPRPNTPDRITIHPDGRKTTTITTKRACNGCGELLGDITDDEMAYAVAGQPLPDVRTECTNCQPLVALEADGCKTWQLTPRNIAWIDDLIDHDGHYAKGYFEAVDGKTTCVGLRIGTGQTRIVAHYGDHLIRRPDGTWTVHKAPAVAQ